MFVNMNMNMMVMEIQQDMIQMMEYCKQHEGCKDCEIYNGSQKQVGNSYFMCENWSKGK